VTLQIAIPFLKNFIFNFQDEKEKAFAIAESESQALTRKLILEQDELEVKILVYCILGSYSHHFILFKT
jgi:hypothetical protein